MWKLRRALLALATLSLSAAAVVEAQSPGSAALSELDEGVRIRANGPGVRDVVRPSVRDVLQGGLVSLVIRPAAGGVVVSATPESLRFAESQRSQLFDVPWSGIDYVDVHRGRSVPVGTLQGAGLGALTGVVMWGLIELIFMAADNPVVEEPGVLIGISAAAGGLYGAAALGDRWDRVYPGRPGS
jgi:hypothetical protein